VKPISRKHDVILLVVIIALGLAAGLLAAVQESGSRTCVR
jgi:hypothetical protein